MNKFVNVVHMQRVVLILLFACASLNAQQRFPARGLILKIDVSHRSMVVSCNAIPGYMEAMTMSLLVRGDADLSSLQAGTAVDFVLVPEKDSLYAESIRIHKYEGLEPDPLTARRLTLLNKLTRPGPKPIETGSAVPDFTLTGQDGRAVAFSKFKGKVVALNFIYTRCALPNFCFRTTNNFGNLQRRFRDRLAKDLVLLTVTFDPAHDTPAVMRKYADIWKADPRAWHFLTGSATDIQRVCDLFGVDYYQDEGLMNHSLHTVVIDRQGRMAANLEGNEFTPEQLGDLVNSVLTEKATQSAAR